MIYTERNIADQECNKIKDLVQASTLNYFVKESPFTLQFTIRKSFIKDFSLVTNASSTPSSQIQSTISTNLESNPNSTANDSGFQNDVDQRVRDIREELDGTILESKNEIMNLKKDIENKDSILIKLKSKINSLEDNSKHLKNDLNIKTEQLKQNKNQVDNLKQTNDKLDK